MNTPVLTKLQQKKSLSAKKKIKKVTIRNIVASPFTNYWPLIKPEDAVALNEVLAENLIELKPPKRKVPWKDIKDIPREKRKDFRLQYDPSKSKLPDIYKSDVVFGVNETTKLLENRTASSILISAQVDPRLMVKHMLDMAVLQDVPVLIVPDLTNLLKEKTGIASVALTFKISSSIVENYIKIDHKIKEIASDYPPPSDHINFHRRENEMKDTETPCLESPMDTTVSEHEKLQSKNLYLYRKSKGYRVFIPELSKQPQSTNSSNKIDVDSSGFLAFGNSEIDEPVGKDTYLNLNRKSKQKTKVSYKSLIIKRVTNNKNRDQKKIELLKRKR